MISKPMTMGECWAIYEKAGLISPEAPLDKSLFHNANMLAGMLNYRDKLKTENTQLNKALDKITQWIADHHSSCLECPLVDTLCEKQDCAKAIREWTTRGD